MSIHFEILGRPDSDNALYVEVDSGKSICRLLFDCGESCLADKSFGQIQKIDHVFFSHFHMDHVSGFDSLFRCVYGRDIPIEFWGPSNASGILQHRFQGFWWNLVEGQAGASIVNDIDLPSVTKCQFTLSDGFSTRFEISRQETDETVLDLADFEVRAIELNHSGPCMGYRINEKPKQNINLDVLKELGLASGPWLRDVKEKSSGQVDIQDQTFEIERLREKLLVETHGDSIAYLTDFRLDSATEKRLTQFVDGCSTVVCEAQYKKEDLDLAQKNFHTTTDQVSILAAKSNIEQLILFHLSERYPQNEWLEMLRQAQDNFPNTSFADHWLK